MVIFSYICDYVVFRFHISLLHFRYLTLRLKYSHVKQILTGISTFRGVIEKYKAVK